MTDRVVKIGNCILINDDCEVAIKKSCPNVDKYYHGIMMVFKMLIYKATNKITGLIYVGQTTKTLEQRKQRHIYISKYKPESYFQKSLKKYGEENFIFEVIEYCNTIEELNQREQYWIKKLNTLKPNGYNLNTGGKNHRVSDDVKQRISQTLLNYYKTHKSKAKGYKHTPEAVKKIKEKNTGLKRSEETKQKLREINLGKHLSEETKQKLREINLGKTSPMKGKKTPEDVREKQRISALKRDRKPFRYCFKPVLCIDTNIIYENIEQASKATNINRSCIGDCCNYRSKSTHKLHFRFLTDIEREEYFKTH